MSAPTSDGDLALLRAYEPVLRFTAGETFLPTTVEGYLRACSLWHQPAEARTAAALAEPGDLTPDRLAELGRAHAEDALSLRFVDQPMGRREVRRWRRDPSRPRFRPSARFAAVGLLGRLIDALMRLSLLFRGRVPGGTAAAAGARYLESADAGVHPYYGRVVRDGGYVVLQYWYLYAMNDWRSSFTGVNDHEGDWEQVTLFLPEGFLPEHADGSTRPAWVAFSSHDDVGADLRRRHDDPDITWVGNHPVVYVGAGSHSGAYLAGEYLVTVQPDVVRRLSEGFRRVIRVLAPWAPQRRSHELGIPFVDYRRGDGVAIGPGGDHGWTPVLVDDGTPWVRDYRGLWGLDTSDPLGGERAPAGPRYERTGQLRESWTDPVGWAALDPEPPTEQDRVAALRARLSELDEEIATTGTTVDRLRDRVRREHVGGHALGRITGTTVPPSPTLAELDATRDRLLRLERERDAVDEALTSPLAPDHPHSHLRHRHVPDIDPAKGPNWLLHVWSMVSVSVLLLGLAAVFLLESRSGVIAFTALIVVLLLVEAATRGYLRTFLLTSSAVLVTVVPLVVIVAAFVYNWRWGVAGVLAAAAISLLVANLRDFMSTR